MTSRIIARFFHAALAVLLAAATASAQLSSSAYRALGQSSLRQNGINRVQGVEFYAPAAVAVDSRDGVLHLYVSDTRNHRVLGWRNALSYQVGDPPEIVLGQAGFQNSGVNGIGIKGLNSPQGLAADPLTGNLYVADTGNNRVLRFPSPFANPSQVEPEAVYGQADFSTRTANTNGVSRTSLSAPRSVAFDASGNLWVADTGNHRVLRFNAAILTQTEPYADLVIGQTDFTSSSRNQGATVSGTGLDTPIALTFDSHGDLYVSDYNNARVLRFATPAVSAPTAVSVFGQTSLTAQGASTQANASLPGPSGLAVDSAGDLYVAVPGHNRILVFLASGTPGTAAKDVIGQSDFTSLQANPGTSPVSSARGFSGVTDVKADSQGNLYVADTGNNRVLGFPHNAKTATQVWGQNNFSTNGVNQVKPGSLNAPGRVAIDYAQSPYALYVSDTSNHRVLVWKDAARFRSGDPADMVIGQPDLTTALANIDKRGSGPSQTSLSSPMGVAVDANSNLYVADSGNNRVLRYPRPVDQSGRITPDAVLGQPDFEKATSAAVSASTLRNPSGVTIGPDGNIFVADTGNHRVLEFPSGSGTNSAAIRVYGQPHFATGYASTPASAQSMSGPRGLFVDAGYTLYVADTGNHRVLIFPNTRDAGDAGMPAYMVLGQDGFETSQAGTGSTRLRTPVDVAEDRSGNIVVADSGNNRVVLFPSLFFVSLAGGTASAVLGQADLNGSAVNYNTQDGQATPEGLSGPQGVFVDRQNTVYIADAGNNRVVHFLKSTTIRHAANSQAGSTLARGGLASVTGDGFADSEQAGGDGALPVVLAGREVVINDEFKVPLTSVGPASIGLQIPFLAPLGSDRIAVRTADTAELIAGGSAVVANFMPGLFSAGDERYGVRNQDGSLNSGSKAADRGSTIKVFGTGQGPVSPQIADGTPAPSEGSPSTVAVPTTDGNACLVTQPSVCVPIGSALSNLAFGDIQFSGLAPGMVGVWQLTLKVPLTAPTGTAVQLRAIINGALSNTITIAIK